MSRRKQTNPRAIKRDVSKDEDENSMLTTKRFATESLRSDSFDSTTTTTTTTEDEQKSSVIKCDTCQETFLTSELFNQHRLYQCSFLTEETNSDDSRTSSYDDYSNQIDKIPYGTSQNEDYPHQCSYCNKSFANMALLLKHEQVHVELMPFRCSFCGKGFKHRRSLNRHSKLHTGERKFKCTVCESTFARSDHLKAHIRTHNNNNNNNNNIHNAMVSDKMTTIDFQFKSSTNPKTNADERQMSFDNKTHRDENKTEHCPYCPRVCLGEDSLRFHIQNEHNQMLEKETHNSSTKSSDSISPSLLDTYCHLCNAKFNSRENYYAHLRYTHPPFPKQFDPTSLFQMPTSKKQHEFTDDSILNEYALIEKIIWCEKCKRSFDSMTVYLQHYTIQHCLQIIKCLQCQDVFETIELFFSHIERVHPSKTVETFKCKLCNATYKNRSDFRHHIESVHKASCSYTCSLCPCQFNSGDELLDHLRFIHKINNNIDISLNNRRPSFNTLFPCAFCSLKFNSRFDLNQHILQEHNDQHKQDSKSEMNHNGKKSSPPLSFDLTCSLCDMTFLSESLLLEHNKHSHRLASVSSVSSSFKCTYCHALFTSRTQLDRHSKIHVASSGNNLKCNICDRLFSTIDVLSEHKLSHCKATTSNICSYCHQTLDNQDDFTRHLYEHNHQNGLRSKVKSFSNTNDTTPLSIACIVCKQSLINEHEIILHTKFHLANSPNKKSTKPIAKESSSILLTLQCNECHRITSNDRDFLVELPSFNSICFNCVEKELKPAESQITFVDESTSKSLCCPKCENEIQFDSIKTYQQHFTSVHASKHPIEEYHCLTCNNIVPSRDHIFQHQKKNSSIKSGFLIDSVDSSIKPRGSSTPSVHYCYLCRTSFDTAIKMHIHLIEHQYPNHDYQCNVCNQSSFDDASQLYHHMVQHGSKARLYPCRQCDVYFMFSMHLINHQSSHTDDIVLSKANGSSKPSIKSKFSVNEDKKQLNDDDDISCKPMVTRSSTKGTCRSVVVS